MMTRILAFLPALAGVALVLACGGGGDDGATPSPATATATTTSAPPAATPPPATPAATASPTGAASVSPEATPATTTAPTPSPATAPPTPTFAPPTATATPAPPEATIRVADNVFEPRNLTVRRGTKVTWLWVGQVPHDLTSTSFPPDAGGAKITGSYSFTFTRAGTFAYECVVHRSTNMRGTVIVQ